MTKDGPLWLVILSVGTGAALGAVGRWALSYVLNTKFTIVPLGTLSANLMGAYLIGICVAWTLAHPGLSPALRLFIITGFLGGLTTFSTFSSENVAMLMAGEMPRALTHMVCHVAGSFLMTYLGLLTYRYWAS